jgi:hypothetical protein
VPACRQRSRRAGYQCSARRFVNDRHKVGFWRPVAEAGNDYQPPQIGIDASGLADAIRQAAAQIRLTVEMPDGAGLVLRFGEQLDTQTVNGGPAGTLTPEHAARYIAKYATKSAEDFGLGERRITPEALPLLDVPCTWSR